MTANNGMKGRRHGLLTVIALPALLAAALAMSCRIPTVPFSPKRSSGGILFLSVHTSQAKAAAAVFDPQVESYVINGVGPNGKSFAKSTPMPDSQFDNLVPGVWNVTVAAVNKNGTDVEMGFGSIAVSSVDSVVLPVDTVPISGTGSISLSTTWTASEVASPSVKASLLPMAGTPIALAESLASGSATASASAIPAGYYTLDVSLLDSGVTVASAAQVISVVAGQSTTASIGFTNLTSPPPSVSVNISPSVTNPLAVSLSGVPTSTVAAGNSFTITPSTAGYSGNVTFVLYLNGVETASSTSAAPSLTVGGNLSAGTYRVDVVAYSADGQRAGSTTGSFTIVDPGSVTLAWDAVTNASVAGYKLHYGQTAGTYSTTIDVGNHTSATVTGLIPGHTYYFAATDYSSSGTASGYSNVVTYTVPAS